MSHRPDTTRRSLLAGLAGLPLATLLADPALAQRAAAATETVTITTVGGRRVAAAQARPTAEQAPAVLLVHEWWGLNDQIRTMAVEFARHGFLALAIDLFQGRLTADPEEARAQTQKVQPAEADDTLVSWAEWLANHPNGTRRLGAVGWCFGGGWALRAATLADIAACVVYYGRANLPEAELARLKGPVLGHFGRQDRFVDARVVTEFEGAMTRLGKPYQVQWYDAGHAFANPTGGNYDREDAQLAWRRTLDFLGKELR